MYDGETPELSISPEQIKFDEDTKGLPTRKVFDGFVDPEDISLRLHLATPGDMSQVEDRLGLPLSPKGLLIRQGLRLIRIPRPAEWELVGHIKDTLSSGSHMRMQLTYWEGIPFSRLVLSSYSQQEGVYDPDSLGDPVAQVLLAFKFPKDMRKITPTNIQSLRLQITPPIASFNSDKFERSTSSGDLTAEGRVAGLMFSAFRRAHAEYVARHPRGVIEINAQPAIDAARLNWFVT